MNAKCIFSKRIPVNLYRIWTYMWAWRSTKAWRSDLSLKTIRNTSKKMITLANKRQISTIVDLKKSLNLILFHHNYVYFVNSPPVIWSFLTWSPGRPGKPRGPLAPGCPCENMSTVPVTSLDDIIRILTLQTANHFSKKQNSKKKMQNPQFFLHSYI